MANADLEWAFPLKLPASQKAVLIALAYCMNGKTGKCFPSQGEISTMTGLADRTVRAALKDLSVPGGPVVREKTVKGRYRSNDEYQFNREWRQEVPEVAAPPASGTTGHRQDMPEPAATDAESGGSTFRAVEPTGIQPEVNTEIMLVPPEAPIRTVEEIFAEAYEGWPKKVDRKDALAKFKIALRKFRGHEQDLLDAIRDHGAAHAQFTPRQFTPSLAVWLNKERWDNDLPEAPEAERRRPTRTEQNLAFVAKLAADQNAQTRGIAS